MISGYYFTALACALVVFLFYKEWMRKNKRRLWGRLLASLLAATSLFLMAYPFSKENETTFKNIALLTDGFVNDSVDHFLQGSNNTMPVYTVENAMQYAGRQLPVVTDLAAFVAKHSADTLHVFGNGFSDEQLALLNRHSIVFHGGAVLPAITDVYWKQQLEAGEPLVVQGVYENTTAKKIKIVLAAFGAGKDTVFIKPGNRSEFVLQTVPLHAGKAVFAMVVTAGNDTLQNEPVPVEIKTPPLLQLLIVSSSPDFDNTYLKNYLAQQGYQVSMITSISSGKADRQFLNMQPPLSAARISVPYLSKFDVLMTDQQALQKLSVAELAAIRTVVQDKGTGLIIKMEEESKAAFYAKYFPVKKLPENNAPFVVLRNGATDSNRYSLKMTDPLGIGYTAGMQIILQDAKENIYAAGVLYGSGKIIGTTLQNTFSMALAGNKISYGQLWWLLLNKAAKKIYPDESWRTHPIIPFANTPVQWQVENEAGVYSKAAFNQTTLYFKKDPWLPFASTAVYWPVQTGWQQLPVSDATPDRWYVYKKGDWQQMMEHQFTVATKKYASRYPVATSTALTGMQHAPFNTGLYCLLVFLAACFFLWVEQKMG